jgi:flavodoxin
MKAIVVYESLWDNTAAIAHTIAEGIGPEARKRLDKYTGLIHTTV